MKYLMMVTMILMLSGCGFTQLDVAKELSVERSTRHKVAVDAKAEATKYVMKMLSTIDRGGMKIDTTEDGRIKSISYVDRLDMSVLKEALQVPVYKEERVASMLGEMGDTIMKATGMVVPVASILIGGKNHRATTSANVAMTQSNNKAQTNMIGAYTGSFENTTNIDTSSTNIDTSSISTDLKDYSTDKDYSRTTTTTKTTSQ